MKIEVQVSSCEHDFAVQNRSQQYLNRSLTDSCPQVLALCCSRRVEYDIFLSYWMLVANIYRKINVYPNFWLLPNSMHSFVMTKDVSDNLRQHATTMLNKQQTF